MPQDSAIDALVRFGQRVRKAVSGAPKPEPISEEKRKATETAVGPRFRDTRKKAAPASPVVAKPSVRTRRRTRKGPSKY